jgi:hypothetical protein
MPFESCRACPLIVTVGFEFMTALSKNKVGRGNSVGIATRYGLDGQGIEVWLGRDFPHPSRPALGPSQPLLQWVPGISRG